MQIDCSFSLTDIAVSAICNQSTRMLDNISGLSNERTNVFDVVGAENYMDIEFGSRSRESLIDKDNVPVRMMNLIIAAQTYETNVGLLSRYKQMTEIKLELMG